MSTIPNFVRKKRGASYLINKKTLCERPVLKCLGMGFNSSEMFLLKIVVFLQPNALNLKYKNERKRLFYEINN